MYLYIEDLAGGYIGPFESEEAALAHAAKYYPDHYEHRPFGSGYRCEVHLNVSEGESVESAEENASFWDNFDWKPYL